MKRTCTILASILPALCALAVPRYWEADVRSPAAFQTAAYRGETVQLTARLADRGAPFEVPAGATARMLVSTNDFRDGCWEWPATVSTNGLVRATWTPDMDPGGPAVRIFLAVSESGTNVNYGANCTMRLLGSPGATPNALPLPVMSLDFSTVAVSNAPWIETETDPTVPEWAKAPAPPLSAESDPVFAEWAETNEYVKAENDPLGRYALRRTLAETNSASWAVVEGEGVELLADGSVVAFTNEYIAAGDGYVVRSFDIVPVSPRGGVPLDAAIFEDWSAGSPDQGAILPEGPEVGIVPTNGILRVEAAFRRGERRYKVSRCILAVRSLSFGPADMAEAARDDLTADDYRFRDNIGEASLGNLRQWATNEFAAKSAERWWQTTAGGGVSLGGNTLALGAGRFAQTLDADATNVLLTAGGQDALRVVDGYGLAGDTNAEWRISGLRRTGANVEVTVRCAMPGPWKSVALHGSRDAAEWEETDFAPAIDGETWTYLVPTNTGYRFFKCAGSLVAHPDSRLETDFSISAMGDVTASNGLHRLSAKADASALAGYSPTGHVHAASDITNALSASQIPNLPQYARTNCLAGMAFDFSDLRGLYVAVSNLAAALGGTVTNFPSFQQ